LTDHPVNVSSGAGPLVSPFPPHYSTHFPGYLRVEFGYAECSRRIELRCYVHGATTIKTGCHLNDGTDDLEVVVEPDALLLCWSDWSSGFFRKMISWLEAVVAGVREGSFIWECHWPKGELRWHRDSSNSGNLQFSWSGDHGWPAFEHQAQVNRHQMVEAMYNAFVALIESDAYDPILCEPMTDGERFGLVVTEGAEALAEEIARRDRSSAFQLIQVVYRRVIDAELGPRRGEDLASFKLMAEMRLPVDLTDEIERDEINFLLGAHWDGWTFEERLAYVHEIVYAFWSDGLAGDWLRELRSERIETWLLEQASRPQTDTR
jgi:hypothetical protein